MAVAGPSLIVLLVGATLLLGGLALVVALLVNPKTRWIVLTGAGVVAVLAAFSFVGVRNARVAEQTFAMEQRSHLLQMQQDIARDIAEAHDAGPGGSHTEDSASHNPAPSEQELAQMRVRVQELEAELAELGAHGAAAGQSINPKQRFYSTQLSAAGILAAVAVLVVIVLLVKAAPGLSLVGLGVMAVLGVAWLSATSVTLERRPQPVVGGSDTPLPTHSEPEQIVLTEEVKSAAEAEADLPEWVRNPAADVNHDALLRVVVTEPFLSREEAERDADRMAAEAAVARLSELVGEPLEAAQTSELGFDPASWSQALVKRRYTQEIKTSVAPVWKSYALVEIVPNDLALMKASWVEAQQSKRVATVAQGGLGAFGLVALALGLVKLDQSTGQRYTKRLLIGAPAAIIAVMAMLLALA